MGSVWNQMSDSTSLMRRIEAGKSACAYRNMESVFDQGDAADSLFYIDHGNVKLTARAQTGNRVVLAILRGIAGRR